MYIVKAKEMQEIDKQTINTFGLPGLVLMENAGRSAVEYFMETFIDIKHKKVAIIAGRGNNGGDGFVIARYLFSKNIDVKIYLCCSEDVVKGDAKTNLNLCYNMGVEIIELFDQEKFEEYELSMAHRNIWIDALLGTGLKSEVKGYYKYIIDYVNSLKKPVFSVDIPSGLNADTGKICGSAIMAKATITFGLAKIGLVVYPGASYVGSLKIADIGIPPKIVETLNPKQNLLTEDMIKSYIKPRIPEAHKGTTGHIMVIAGSKGKTGAAAMTAMSAMRSGAGLVTLGIAESINNIMETQVLEAMTLPLSENESGFLSMDAFEDIMVNLDNKKCLALGPGLGMSEETGKLVRKLIQEVNIPIVLDADGINHLERHTEILHSIKAPMILTPHPGELARLLDMSVSDLLEDRITIVKEFTEEFKVHLVLKGAKSVIGHPYQSVYINPTGNSGMASGGMGDVLTGIIASFIGQGYPLEFAIRTAVYIHGMAGDILEVEKGVFGYLASDIMLILPKVINKFSKN